MFELLGLNSIRKIKTRWKVLMACFSGALIVLLATPMPKFNSPTSTVVFSCEGELLGARIAPDGQWRFPKTQEVPSNYAKALTTYEDQWFYFHPGVNPLALVRALVLNIRHHKVVSGGSTLTMQVARLSRDNPPRTVVGKVVEIAMAFKLELFRSKKEILRMYASAAPFGGNVVGIDAASWRYFNRPADQLSWAEAAVLAVLPNSPSLIYPGRNSGALKQKRDQLLTTLCRKGVIDQVTLEASLAEPLPSQPYPLPDVAGHVVDRFAKEKAGQKVITTLQYELQRRVDRVVERHQRELAQNNIFNISALVIDVETGNILAYIGNTRDLFGDCGGHVDVAMSPRSSGSILKPLLYASMLNYGEMLPHALVPDIPINFGGYAPKNFDFSYSGAVPASQALSRSINVPAVEMLHQFGEARFLDVLRGLGFTSFRFPSEHYGLSLILGGGETSLFELGGVYTSLARVLKHYTQFGGYSDSDISMPLLTDSPAKKKEWKSQPVLSAASIWFAFEALREVNRPDERSGWVNFSSSRTVAWKTGTSFGFRDAWAVGSTPDYVVAVWAGNSNGEGRPGLTGVRAAAPVLFDIIDLLPNGGWFEKPTSELTVIDVCAESGCRASPICPHIIRSEVPLAGLKTEACPYHRLVHLSEDRQWQVNASCYPVGKIVNDSCFILPPGMEWFYRKLHPDYRVLPPMMKGCDGDPDYPMIELLYPKNLSTIFIPKEHDGTRGKVVFEAAHRNMDARLFWHVDDEYIGETSHFHQMALSPTEGVHVLTIIDTDGNTLKRRFFVASEAIK